jgi:polyisoprenyl-teichoic acid--peptidoglycan teichoic acid transferase
MENKNSRMNRKKQGKKNKSHKKLLIGLCIILGIIIIPVLSGAIYTEWQLSKLQKTHLNKSDSALGIKSDVNQKLDNTKDSDKITNIALFGTDRRNKDENGNSDSIMIASIDTLHKKIKLTSIMRDTRVNITGVGLAKINEAYARGGPQLAIKTINSDFDLNIKDFVSVDFYGLAKIIVNLGGVEINIQQDEIQYINSYMNSTPGIDPKLIKIVKTTGLQNLTGTQAVAYSRIRYTAGNDFMRTERQRTVLTALLNKVKDGGLSKYSSLVSTLLPLTTTSLSSSQIISLGTSVLTTGSFNADQERFPVDGYCNGQTINNIWYLVPIPDLKTTVDQLYNYIYKDIKPTPLKPLT